MLGAIDIALSGLDAYSQGLQIISNNVANLDTAGYKAQTVSFSDIFDNGGGGLTYGGGNTAEQSGNGVIANQPGIDFTQGTMQQTGGNLDIAVQGNGFITLQSKDGQTLYTTTGQFSVDSTTGYINENNTTDHLEVLNASGQATAVDINDYNTSPAVATTAVVLNGTLESSNTSTTSSTTPTTAQVTVYDANGNSHAWTVSATPDTATAGDWTVTVTDETGATIGTGTLTPNGSSYGTLTATGSYAGATAVSLDFTAVTNIGASNALTVSSTGLASAGYPSATNPTVSINTAGQVLLSYSNGQTKQLGAVAIANFSNPQKLTQITGGFFENNSGQKASLLASGVNQNGTLVSQQIEASNVNLSQEFGDLILIQRGFQASSEVLSTANDMIQQLFGVRGQG